MKTQKVENRRGFFVAATFTGAASLHAHAGRWLLAGMLGGKVWPDIHFLPPTRQEAPQKRFRRRGVWRSTSGGWGGQRNIEAESFQRKSSWGKCFSSARCVLSVWSVGDLICSPCNLMSRQAWRHCDKAKNAAGAHGTRAAASAAAVLVQWESELPPVALSSPQVSMLFFSSLFLPPFTDWLFCFLMLL